MRTFGLLRSTIFCAIPLIKDFGTAMSAIRKMIFTSLKNEHTESEEHKRHYISEIASLIIELPSKEKQSRIAYLMTSLDNKLVLEENTMARYMDEKQYILSQMFI